jgi:hypothetical protein
MASTIMGYNSRQQLQSRVCVQYGVRSKTNETFVVAALSFIGEVA